MIHLVTIFPAAGQFSDATVATDNRKACLQRQGRMQGLSGRISLKINLLYSIGYNVREFDRSTTMQQPLQPFKQLLLDAKNIR